MYQLEYITWNMAAARLKEATTAMSIRNKVEDFLILLPPFLFFKCWFIYSERESARAGEGEREGERENPKQASALSARSLMQGSNSWIPEIMTWAETKSWILNRMSHPGAPSPLSMTHIQTLFQLPTHGPCWAIPDGSMRHSQQAGTVCKTEPLKPEAFLC